MFSLQPLLEGCYVSLAIRGFGPVHFIGTIAIVYRTSYALRLERGLRLANFCLKLLICDHIRSIGFWHLSRLPQSLSLKKRFSRHSRRVLNLSSLVRWKPLFG